MKHSHHNYQNAEPMAQNKSVSLCHHHHAHHLTLDSECDVTIPSISLDRCQATHDVTLVGVDWMTNLSMCFHSCPATWWKSTRSRWCFFLFKWGFVLYLSSPHSVLWIIHCLFPSFFFFSQAQEDLASSIVRHGEGAGSENSFSSDANRNQDNIFAVVFLCVSPIIMANYWT